MAIIDSQNLAVLDDYSKPEPDIALIRLRPPGSHLKARPRAEDVLLLIEVYR